MNILFLLLWTLSIKFAKGQNLIDYYSSKCSVIIRDVVFVVEASESISKTDVQLAQRIFIRIITYLKESNNQNRIALVTFGDSADIVFDFSKYDSIDGMLKSVDAIKHHNGLTAIGKALNLTWVELFPTMRTDAEKLIILLTDGINNKYPAPYDYADKLKTAGVKIMTVGIGSDINEEELDILATKGLLVMFISYSDFLNGPDQIIKQMCAVTVVCENPELNLAILMPISFSLNDTTFAREKSLVVKLLEKLHPICDTSQISIMFYTSYIKDFVKAYSNELLENLISYVNAYQKENEIDDDYVKYYFKWEIKDLLPEEPHHALLISAGKHIINPESFQMADKYKADGGKIITVGIGSDDYSNEMKALSSNGKFLVVNSSDEIEEIAEIVYRMITSDHRK